MIYKYSPCFWLKSPRIWCSGDCVKDEDRGIERTYKLMGFGSPAKMLRIHLNKLVIVKSLL